MSGGDFVKQKIKLEWPYIINKSDCTVLILHTQRFCDVRSVLCHLLSDFEKVLLSCFCSKLHCKFLAFSLLRIPDDSSRVPFGFQVFSVIFLLLSSSPDPKFLSLLFIVTHLRMGNYHKIGHVCVCVCLCVCVSVCLCVCLWTAQHLQFFTQLLHSPPQW